MGGQEAAPQFRAKWMRGSTGCAAEGARRETEGHAYVRTRVLQGLEAAPQRSAVERTVGARVRGLCSRAVG